MEAVLKHDRHVILAAVAGITLLAWGYMIYEAWAMYETGVCCCAGMKMSGPDTSPWSASTLFPLFLMWTEMMVAMMLLSATPMILAFAMVQRNQRVEELPFIPTGIFLLGYLAVWTVFSALAAIAQWVLHGMALLSPMMVGTSPILGGALLIAAGIFQWLPTKYSCLAQCHSPRNFLANGWSDGNRGAFLMGLKHGQYCLGCCWALMTVLFVAGVMNIWWIAVLTLFVLAEKLSPRRWMIGPVSGVLLVAWGVWLIASK
jgi:predicted metal-binding membrane protein